MPIINVAGIVRNSYVDGPGIRYALFVQGCPHHCPGCHNPETHPYTGGQKISTETILEEIRTDFLLDGVTLSGGEPMAQAASLVPFAKQVKAMGLHLIVYTGYTMEEIANSDSAAWRTLASLADWVIDGRYDETKRNLDLKWRGSENQRIIENPKEFLASCAVKRNVERP